MGRKKLAPPASSFYFSEDWEYWNRLERNIVKTAIGDQSENNQNLEEYKRQVISFFVDQLLDRLLDFRNSIMNCNSKEEVDIEFERLSSWIKVTYVANKYIEH